MAGFTPALALNLPPLRVSMRTSSFVLAEPRRWRMSGDSAGRNECEGWLAVNVTVRGDDAVTNEVIKGVKV